MYTADPFAARMPEPQGPRRLTQEQIEERRALLAKLGQEGSLLDRGYQWRAEKTGQRDAMQAALRQSAMQSVAKGASSL